MARGRTVAASIAAMTPLFSLFIHHRARLFGGRGVVRLTHSGPDPALRTSAAGSALGLRNSPSAQLHAENKHQDGADSSVVSSSQPSGVNIAQTAQLAASRPSVVRNLNREFENAAISPMPMPRQHDHFSGPGPAVTFANPVSDENVPEQIEKHAGGAARSLKIAVADSDAAAQSPDAVVHSPYAQRRTSLDRFWRDLQPVADEQMVEVLPARRVQAYPVRAAPARAPRSAQQCAACTRHVLH